MAYALDADTVNPTAAVSASSLQLARRLADLLGNGDLEEIIVRSADGYVIVNSVGDRWVLTALTLRSANLAMINLAFRDLTPLLELELRSTTATANAAVDPQSPARPSSNHPQSPPNPTNPLLAQGAPQS